MIGLDVLRASDRPPDVANSTRPCVGAGKVDGLGFLIDGCHLCEPGGETEGELSGATREVEQATCARCVRAPA